LPAVRITAKAVQRAEKLLGANTVTPSGATSAELSEVVGVIKGGTTIIADAFLDKAMQVASAHHDGVESKLLAKLITLDLPEGKKPFLTLMCRLLGVDPIILPSNFMAAWSAFAADMHRELGLPQFFLPDIPAELRTIFQGLVSVAARDEHAQELAVEVHLPQVMATMAACRCAVATKTAFAPPSGLLPKPKQGAAAFVTHHSLIASNFRAKEQQEWRASIAAMEAQLSEFKRMQPSKRQRGDEYGGRLWR
jgi:hypothetical protein